MPVLRLCFSEVFCARRRAAGGQTWLIGGQGYLENRAPGVAHEQGVRLAPFQAWLSPGQALLGHTTPAHTNIFPSKCLCVTRGWRCPTALAVPTLLQFVTAMSAGPKELDAP